MPLNLTNPVIASDRLASMQKATEAVRAARDTMVNSRTELYNELLRLLAGRYFRVMTGRSGVMHANENTRLLAFGQPDADGKVPVTDVSLNKATTDGKVRSAALVIDAGQNSCGYYDTLWAVLSPSVSHDLLREAGIKNYEVEGGAEVIIAEITAHEYACQMAMLLVTPSAILDGIVKD